MSLYVLDTDHISLYQKAHPRVVTRIRAFRKQEIAVTIISAEEQLRGWFDAIRQASSGERLQWAYVDYVKGSNISTRSVCWISTRTRLIRTSYYVPPKFGSEHKIYALLLLSILLAARWSHVITATSYKCLG